MSISIEDFGDDVEKDLVNCSSCKTQLLLLEHSPFENGNYLYCDSCPSRADVSIYDKKYEEVEEELKQKYENFWGRDDALHMLLERVEKFLKPCMCGGHFNLKSKIRCLNCSELLGDYPDHMNVWYLDDFDDECDNNRQDTYIIEPEWVEG